MLLQAVLVALCTFICAEAVEFLCWSTLLCAPICFGPVIGLIMGDVESGVIIGSMTQVALMGNIMVGGVATIDYPTAGCIATALAIAGKASPEMGVTIAVSLGMIGMIANNFKMTASTLFVHKGDECAAKGNMKGITFYNVVCPTILTFVLYAIPAFLAIYYGAEYVSNLLSVVPEQFLHILEVTGMFLPALGLAMMMKVLLQLRYLPYFIISYIATVYFELGMIPIALLGAAFALLHWFKSKDMESLSSADASEDEGEI